MFTIRLTNRAIKARLKHTPDYRGMPMPTAKYDPPLDPIFSFYARHRRAVLTLARFTGVLPFNICWGLVP